MQECQALTHKQTVTQAGMLSTDTQILNAQQLLDRPWLGSDELAD